MERAICISCGTSKRLPWKICRECKFDPSLHDIDLVKSVYLSTGRYEEEEDKASYNFRLNQYAETIRNGGSIAFDAGELRRLEKQRKLVGSVSCLGILRMLGVLFANLLPKMLFWAVAIGLALGFIRSAFH